MLIFTAGLFASLQNIHELEEECVLFSFKDAKSRWEVMILMDSSTCQFDDVQGKKMKERIDTGMFICYYSMVWSCRHFFLTPLLKVGIGNE